jgi:hypothetical protein
MTSTTLPRMITVRLTTTTAHLAVSAELGWHDEARVFDVASTTPCAAGPSLPRVSGRK